MEMYYAPEYDGNSDTITFSGPEARHIARVLRHRPGDLVSVTDGRGGEYEVELQEVDSRMVSGRIRSRDTGRREPRCRVDLAQGIIKSDRMDSIVDGVTQIGVGRILPVETARTVAGLSPAKLARLRSIAVGAMKVATRTVLPVVEEPVGLARLIELAPGYDQAVLAYEGERARGIDDVLCRETASVILVVGPEGGFEPEEVVRLQAAGVQSFSLGPRRLRAETAAVVATALVFGRLGGLRHSYAEQPRKGGG